ncbi:MAG: hypothetical protein WC564_02985 [Patescibacteria group bacterium]|jgi:hypothetical protein
MKKVFKLLAYIFVCSVIVFGVVLIVYRQNIFEYLNSVNNLGRSTEAVRNGIQKDNNANAESLNLSVINSLKFKKMQLTEVDLTGLDLSTSTAPIDGGMIGEKPEPTPVFEVGNSNPFKAF